MNTENLNVIAKIAACVCGKDGFISQLEEESIYNIILSQYPSYALSHFNQAIDDFFNETRLFSPHKIYEGNLWVRGTFKSG